MTTKEEIAGLRADAAHIRICAQYAERNEYMRADLARARELEQRADVLERKLMGDEPEV